MDMAKNFTGESISIPAHCTTVGTTRNSLNDMGLLQLYNNTTYFSLTAAKVEVSCVHAQDIAAGTGAQKICIFGLDANFDYQQEEIATGATQSLITKTTKLWTRIFGAEVSVVGSGGVNAGPIWLTKDGLGGTYASGVPGTKTSSWLVIPAGMGFATTGIYTVPRGKKVRLESIMLGARTQVSEFFLFSNLIDNAADNGLKMELSEELSNTGVIQLNFPKDSCYIWKEKSDIIMQGMSTTAGGVISATLNLRWVAN